MVCVGALVVLAATASASDCRLALLLAMDVSSSVDAAEDELQRNGLARALTAPEVQAAFFAAPQPVALAVYEWSGRYNQEILLDWMLIDSPERLRGAAQTLATSKRSHNDFPTALGLALRFGADMFERAPDCAYKTLDIAGDGQNNEGLTPAQVYLENRLDDVTVNGLVVNGADFEAETGLIAFYKGQVIRGPGAFVEIANGFDDYERAMRRKLERELTPAVIGGMPKERAARDS